MAQESRAEYMKERRSKFKAFHVEVERERMELFESHLAKKIRRKRNGWKKRSTKNSANKKSTHRPGKTQVSAPSPHPKVW